MSTEKVKLGYSRNPLIRLLVIRIASYLDRIGTSRKFVENSTKLTYLEITGYRVKYSAVLWLLELQFRRGRKVQTEARSVNSNSQTSNCQYSPFSRKGCLSGFSAYPDASPSQLIRISRVLLYCLKSRLVQRTVT
jgi:hypothetical protein